MNTEVCKTFDAYMRHMTHNEITMSWKAEMLDGSVIWGDYERPGYEKCWERFKMYCEDNKTSATSIKLYMFGMPEYTFFEDPEGLDGFSIMRGCSRDQSLDGSHQDFQFLSVSLLRPECDKVDVRKFIWPETDLEPEKEIREVVEQSINQMIFKHDSKKIKHAKIQEYINGAAV